jgi:hypothetical protein
MQYEHSLPSRTRNADIPIKLDSTNRRYGFLKFWPFSKKAQETEPAALPDGIVLADGGFAPDAGPMYADPQTVSDVVLEQQPENHDHSLDVIFPEASRPPILTIDHSELKPVLGEAASRNGKSSKRRETDDPDFIEPKGPMPKIRVDKSSASDDLSPPKMSNSKDFWTMNDAIDFGEETPVEDHALEEALPLHPEDIEAANGTSSSPKKHSSLFQPPSLSEEDVQKLPSSIIPQDHLHQQALNPLSPYQDSMADNLEKFGQRVMLQDAQFLKRSIDNLVENYFSLKDDEENLL